MATLAKEWQPVPVAAILALAATALLGRVRGAGAGSAPAAAPGLRGADAHVCRCTRPLKRCRLPRRRRRYPTTSSRPVRSRVICGRRAIGPGAEPGYYWVPGTWVQPPRVGVSVDARLLGLRERRCTVFHAGYWGPHIGYYGGVHGGLSSQSLPRYAS